MVQRKKEDVRVAILEAAFSLFSERGYSETSIPAIAKAAGFSTANVYVYFGSKIEILYALYEPWLIDKLDRLDRSLRRIADPEARLSKLLLAIWRDLPRDSNGFANNVMQAVSTSAGNGEYSPRLRLTFEDRVAHWLRHCVPDGARPMGTKESHALASVILMAFDGFAMNVRLVHGAACTPQTARLAARWMLATRT
jgi:AcrR family transcriptional regulator